MSAVTAPAVWDNGAVRVLDREGFVGRLTKAEYGQGRALVVRVEPEEEAIRHGDYKHLYGHVYLPVVDFTGMSDVELHLQAKAKFMPDDGRTSVTQLSRDEFRVFTEHVDQWLREDMWEAFERWSAEEYRRRRDARRRKATA